jgi:hypothetical protein
MLGKVGWLGRTEVFDGTTLKAQKVQKACTNTQHATHHSAITTIHPSIPLAHCIGAGGVGGRSITLPNMATFHWHTAYRH